MSEANEREAKAEVMGRLFKKTSALQAELREIASTRGKLKSRELEIHRELADCRYAARAFNIDESHFPLTIPRNK